MYNLHYSIIFYAIIIVIIIMNLPFSLEFEFNCLQGYVLDFVILIFKFSLCMFMLS